MDLLLGLLSSLLRGLLLGRPARVSLYSSRVPVCAESEFDCRDVLNRSPQNNFSVSIPTSLSERDFFFADFFFAAVCCVRATVF